MVFRMSQRIGPPPGKLPPTLSPTERAAVTRTANKTTGEDGRLSAKEVREQVAPAFERSAPKSQAVAALREKIAGAGGKIDAGAQRELSTLAARFDLGAAVASLTPAERKSLAAVKEELSFLQTLWPNKLETGNPLREYDLMAALPKELGDRHTALLRPIAQNIARAQSALNSYQTATNLPRRSPEPAPRLNRYDEGFSAALRTAIAEGRDYLPAAVAGQLEAVAAAWDRRDEHPGIRELGTPAFHRETEVEQLTKLAGLKLDQYPDADLLEAKQAWDAGERTVYFTQDNGGSDHQTMSVPKRLNTEGEFLRDYVRAASGTFAHWQEI